MNGPTPITQIGSEQGSGDGTVFVVDGVLEEKLYLVDDELILITSVGTPAEDLTEYNCDRAQKNTLAATHLMGVGVFRVINVEIGNELITVSYVDESGDNVLEKTIQNNEAGVLSGGVPGGGTTGQALVKTSDTTGDVEWGVPAGLIPVGGPLTENLDAATHSITNLGALGLVHTVTIDPAGSDEPPMKFGKSTEPPNDATRAQLFCDTVSGHLKVKLLNNTVVDLTP